MHGIRGLPVVVPGPKLESDRLVRRSQLPHDGERVSVDLQRGVRRVGARPRPVLGRIGRTERGESRFRGVLRGFGTEEVVRVAVCRGDRPSAIESEQEFDGAEW
jgi:Tfp pilus assembly protein PilX